MAIVSCLRHLRFGEEKKMKFRRGKMVFYRLKIRSETANVAEVNVKKLRGVSRYFCRYQKICLTWIHLWSPSQNGTMKLVSSFKISSEESVCGKCMWVSEAKESCL